MPQGISTFTRSGAKQLLFIRFAPRRQVSQSLLDDSVKLRAERKCGALKINAYERRIAQNSVFLHRFCS